MNRAKTVIKTATVILVLTIFFSVISTVITGADETPYNTYTLDGYGRVTKTQTAYLPYETITKFDAVSLKSPSDICVTKDGKIFIADTGNSRIVVGDIDGNLLQIIGEGVLDTPCGVFVTDEGYVYVADRDANMIYQFDSVGNVVNEYGKPQSPLYGDSLSFLPIKIVVNDAGIMYVICESNTNGIVEISPTEGGTFLGYFGTNFASADIMTIIYRAILTDAQRAKMVSNIPATPNNLCIDEKGLIYGNQR